jgi:hypothetical protein
MPIATELEKAYLAGIIDGEGCIGGAELQDKRAGRGAGVMFTVFIGMTDREAAELACSLYGGHIRKTQDKRRKAFRRPMFIWQAYGEIGARFLRDVLPYLRIKHEQAKVFIEARATFTGGPKKGHQGCKRPSATDIALRFDCLRRLKSLNQREPQYAR